MRLLTALTFAVSLLGNCLNSPVIITTVESDLRQYAYGLEDDEFFVGLFVHTSTSEINDSGLGNNIGHAYIEITNNCQEATFWQCFQLNPGCSIDIGLWGDNTLGSSSSISTGHDGIYINREYYYYSKLETPGPCRFVLSVGNTSNLWDYYSLVWQRFNTYDLLNYNCVDFAIEAFGILTGDVTTFAATLSTPYNLYSDMGTQTAYTCFNGTVEAAADEFYSYTDSRATEVIKYS